MEWLIDVLRANPVIPILLTIGIGFWLGKFSWKGVGLGSVTSVLLVGVLMGQLDIPIGPPLKSLFFLLFLFAIGYKCGPQFAGAMRGSGLRQIIFALVICLISFVATYICAKIMGYNSGIAAGLYAGSQTTSPVLGVAIDAIGSLSISDDLKQQWINILPVCYAVTYLYGAIGAVWILGTIGPKMLGGIEKVRRQTRELEAELSHSTLSNDPAFINANRPIAFRAYKVESGYFQTPRTVKDIENHLASQGRRLFVERIRTAAGEIAEPAPDYKVQPGCEIVLSGRHEFIVKDESWIGPEVYDPALLAFNVEKTRVMATGKVARMTVDELRAQPFMYGVAIAGITRDEGVQIPVLPKTRLQQGDMIAICGLPQEVREAAPAIGVEERPTNETDIIFLCLAIALGAFVGTLAVHIGNVSVSLSTSGGALISGIFFGWLRTRHPSVGMIPDASLWLLNNLGLNMFIAAIGIEAGPTFVSGIEQVGPMLFVMGFIATTVPLFLAIIIGDKIFKFHPAINLGCCAGGRKTTPGIGAVTSALHSSVPALGYTITYAVSNTCSIFMGVAIVILFA